MDLEDEDEYRPSVLAFAHMVMSSPRERKKKRPNEVIRFVKDKVDGCVKKKEINENIP